MSDYVSEDTRRRYELASYGVPATGLPAEAGLSSLPNPAFVVAVVLIVASIMAAVS